jgi:hypothetical protein
MVDLRFGSALRMVERRARLGATYRGTSGAGSATPSFFAHGASAGSTSACSATPCASCSRRRASPHSPCRRIRSTLSVADADQKSSGNKGIAITNDGERHMRSIGPINRPADIERLNNGPKATWDRATYDKLQALK